MVNSSKRKGTAGETLAEFVNPILVPTQATLDKYGVSKREWLYILDRQGYACGACGNVPPSKRLNFDHEHVKGWKAMPPEKRRLYVRGLLCYMCNSKRLSRGATIANLRGAADYLEAYELRKASRGN